MSSEIKTEVIKEIKNLEKELGSIADFIHQNPEPGLEEFQAVKLLTNKLSQEGFEVQQPIAGLETAFKASYQSQHSPYPKIGFLAEYDALPEGHSCGHNLIAAMSYGAGVALKRLLDKFQGGTIEIYGTPAEETDGAKVTMVEQGIFNHLDAALICHPGSKNMVLDSSLAMDAIEFKFYGKAAHAAAAPHEGINALDAVISLFNNINSLRQQLTTDVRIHGIITEGGSAPNIIPEKGVARFYVRASERDYLNQVVSKVINCASGAAQATGCQYEYDYFELSFDNMITNKTLADSFQQNLKELGAVIHAPGGNFGSTDMGNVSHVTPSIHPFISISSRDIAAHTDAFKEAAGSKEGKQGMLLGAKALAMTGADLLVQPELIDRIKADFEN
ncbi:M20 family metallopeptidase [Natranaerobius thermophilus]|uniref:Peptidase M20 domain-containing protein 2 n=1 Tax=Natranaerobius thermophilus (strain ATCC BAA-1301 / DSM 18059 / JW/NM-WN-LF) TaxID=457570 RepID=B2A1G1_NATTJ|nr:M20 family metallopeptidase [Natranaerobius thermophilus]ACB84701.1 amidohydrolase [Natranaerobius thermophilus JW/NM-WN-LF]